MMFTEEELDAIESIAVLAKANAKGELALARQQALAYGDRAWYDSSITNPALRVKRAQLVIDAVKRERGHSA